MDMPGVESRVPSLRIPWVDSCKGIGILLVVLGHTSDGTWMQRFIYVFHMPLFFFFSGFVHVVQPDLATFARKKAIHLLVPYLSFLVLLSPLQLLHEARHEGSAYLWQSGVTDLLWGGNHLRGLLGVFWFVTCLFSTQQFANLLLLRCSSRQAGAMATLCLVTSYLNSFLVAGFQLPLNLHVVLAAIPFFLAGYLWRRMAVQRWWINMAGAIGVIASLGLTYLRVPIEYDMKDTNYGVPILSFALALCCILAVVQLSMWTSDLPTISTIFASLGSGSMGIMFLHRSLMYVPASRWISKENAVVYGVVICIACYGLTLALGHFNICRAFLFGSVPEFDAITGKWLGKHPRPEAQGEGSSPKSHTERRRVPGHEEAG